MATLTEVLGAQSFQQADVVAGVDQGMKTAMGLATMKEKVEGQRVELEQQKEALEVAKYNKALGSLTTLARTRPDIAKKMVPKVQENLMKAGIAVDPTILEVMASDEEKKRQMLSISDLLSGQAQSKEQRAASLQALNDWGAFDQGLDAILSQTRLQQTEKIAQMKMEQAAQQTAVREAGKAERQDKALAAKAEGEIAKDVKALAKDFGKEGLADAISSLDSIESLVGGSIESRPAIAKFDRVAGLEGFAAGLKIPWTSVAPLENAVLSGQDLKLYQSVASLRNNYLKMRSGGAVTDNEADRFLQELGTGGIRTGEQLQNGVSALARALRTGVKNIESGVRPEAVQIYRQRGGPIASEKIMSPAKQSAAPAPQVDEKKAQALRSLKNPDGTPRYTEEQIAALLKGR